MMDLRLFMVMTWVMMMVLGIIELITEKNGVWAVVLGLLVFNVVGTPLAIMAERSDD